MRVGIVGFAGSGKSTLFELLTGTAPDPARIHAGQVGVATLSDPRLDFLAALHKPKKVTPASVEFLDTPGLMPGSHADNPQRLALIREGDALLIVLNGYLRRRPGSPARRVSRRDALRRSGCRHHTARAAGSQSQEASAGPRVARQGARDRQVGARGPRRGKDGCLPRPLRGRQETSAIVRPLDRQTRGGPAEYPPGTGDS